jgi:hypothetical protein
MTDIVAAIVLATLGVVVPGVLILASPLDGTTARRLALAVAGWLAGVTALAAAGLFSSASSVGTPAIGVAVTLPVLLGSASAARGSALRALAFGVPLALLVAVNVGRLLGAFFLLLHAEGRLPRTFAAGAGWGDIAIAALALPLAWAVHRRIAGWWTATLVWNALGFLDLVAAVTLGVGSAPGSPFRFIHEAPGSGAMGTLPWLLIPGFLVPIYLLTHLAVFARLARERESVAAVLQRP